MPRQKEPFSLIQRKPSPYLYFKLAGWKTYKSTGKKTKSDAMVVVQEAIEKETKNLTEQTLGEYLQPYFRWTECPHVRRLREENKSISKEYVEDQRKRMERLILPDPISKRAFSNLKRADVLDFRSRLVAAGVGARTINRTIGILKIICKEAYFRMDIDRDPSLGIGEMKYEKNEIGTFSTKEIKALFEECPGVWRDRCGYTAFLLAAHCGLRRNEILGLQWKQVDFDNSVINVNQALRGREIAPPKWQKVRISPITEKCIEELKKLRSESSWILPDSFVICPVTGEPFGVTWWRKRFYRAMKLAGIDRVGRNLRPHSFRHSLGSLLAGAGADGARIRASMGWSSEAVQAGYIHWQAEHFDGQREIIEKLLG